MKTKRILKTTLNIVGILLTLSLFTLILIGFIAIWEICPKDILEKIVLSSLLSVGLFLITGLILYHYIEENY